MEGNGPAENDTETQNFLLQYFIAKKVMQDPYIQNAMRLLHGTDNISQDELDKKADEKVHQLSDVAKRIQS